MPAESYKLNLADVNLSLLLNTATFSIDRDSNLCDVEANKLAHNHSTHEMMIVTNGEVTVKCENKSVTCKNEIIIISPKLLHYCSFNHASAIVFNFSLKKNDKKSPKVYKLFNNAIASDIVTLPISEKGLSFANALYSCSESELSDEAVPHLLSLLFLDIFDHFASIVPHKNNGVKDTYITNIDVYISANLDKHISLEDLAQKLHICSKQVSRIIKKEYGCTLSELLNKRRTGVASMLLTNTNLKISEIAETVGYSTASRFINSFKKQYGITPQKWKKEKQAFTATNQ